MQWLNRLGTENQLSRLTICCEFEPQVEHNYRRILLALKIPMLNKTLQPIDKVSEIILLAFPPP